MELFGGLTLSLSTLINRHLLSLGSFQVPTWLTSPISLSRPQPCSLQPTATEQTQSQLVDSWISALYGNEGIDDELLGRTSPRVMLSGLAVTIVGMSLKAYEVGVVDMESEFCFDYVSVATISAVLLGLVRKQIR